MKKCNLVLGCRDFNSGESLGLLWHKNSLVAMAVFHDAFRLLTYIIQYQPTMALVAIDFPYLSAVDIIETIRRKGIKTKVVIVIPNDYSGALPNSAYIRLGVPNEVTSIIKEIKHN